MPLCSLPGQQLVLGNPESFRQLMYQYERKLIHDYFGLECLNWLLEGVQVSHHKSVNLRQECLGTCNTAIL